MKRAYLFPGQGAQHVGMGSALCAASAEAQAVFDGADAALGLPLTRLCHDGPRARLTATEFAQPALLTHSVAVARALEAQGHAPPSALCGHSLGEWTALVVAGALTFEDAVRLVRLRGRLMQQAAAPGVGSMSAIIGMDEETLQSLCLEVSRQDSVVALASLNASTHMVVAGHREAVTRLEEQALRQGALKALPLEVSAPFHSCLMAPACEPLQAALEDTDVSTPHIPVRSTTMDGWLVKPDEIRRALVLQLTSPVRWEPCVRAVHLAGHEEAWVLGAGRALSRMVQRLRLGWKVRWVDTTDEVAALSCEQEGANP